jgi:hypothetical protein
MHAHRIESEPVYWLAVRPKYQKQPKDAIAAYEAALCSIAFSDEGSLDFSLAGFAVFKGQFLSYALLRTLIFKTVGLAEDGNFAARW